MPTEREMGERRHAFVEGGLSYYPLPNGLAGGPAPVVVCRRCGLPPDAEVHREAEPEKALVELARLVGPDLLNVTSEDIAAIRDGSAMFASPPPQAQPKENQMICGVQNGCFGTCPNLLPCPEHSAKDAALSLLQMARQELERLPASDQQTKVAVMLADLNARLRGGAAEVVPDAD